METLTAQKDFFERSATVVEGILADWPGVTQRSDDPQRRVQVVNAGIALRAEATLTHKRLVELKLCMASHELNSGLETVLLSRTLQQINSRLITVPYGFHLISVPKQSRVTEWDHEQHMWLAHSEWKSSDSHKVHLSLLCGRSDGQDWAVRVPGTIQTIKAALDWITPASVRRAQAAGKEVHRQGDIYFIPYRKGDSNMSALSGTDHRWGYHVDDRGVKNAAIVVKHPQHPDVVLEPLGKGYKWMAVRQTQLGYDNKRINAD